LPIRLKLRPSGAVLNVLGMVRLDGGEPARVFNCRANPVRAADLGATSPDLAADFVQVFGYRRSTPLGSARVRVYAGPDRPTVVLISDRECASRCDDPISLLACRVSETLGLAIDDVIWIEEHSYLLTPCRGGHTPVERYRHIVFGHGTSRSDVDRGHVARLIGGTA
jgi:hypothetical protein